MRLTTVLFASAIAASLFACASKNGGSPSAQKHDDTSRTLADLLSAPLSIPVNQSGYFSDSQGEFLVMTQYATVDHGVVDLGVSIDGGDTQDFWDGLVADGVASLRISGQPTFIASTTTMDDSGNPSVSTYSFPYSPTAMANALTDPNAATLCGWQQTKGSASFDGLDASGNVVQTFTGAVTLGLESVANPWPSNDGPTVQGWQPAGIEDTDCAIKGSPCLSGDGCVVHAWAGPVSLTLTGTCGPTLLTNCSCQLISL